MKRKAVALIAILIAMFSMSSCTYEILEFPEGNESQTIISPDDGRFIDVNMTDIAISGLTANANIQPKDVLLNLPYYFTHYFSDGFFNEVLQKIGLELPDISIRPSRALSTHIEIDAVDEVLSIGNEFLNWEEVYLERLSLKADGSVKNLLGLILHHSDPMEWPLNVPFSGTLNLNLRAGIRNGSDKMDEPMPKAMISARIAISFENVKFDTINMNDNTIPFPIDGRICISSFDVSLASSHITMKNTNGMEFPPLDDTSVKYETDYAPFKVNLHVNPTRNFKVSNIYNAIKNIIKDNENIESYWSYIVNTCWNEFDGDHIILRSITGYSDGKIKDLVNIPDLSFFQALILGIS